MTSPRSCKTYLSFIILVVMMTSHEIVAAQTRLSIKAADSLDFNLSMDNNIINNMPLLSMTLDKLPAGKHSVKVTVPSKPEIVIDQTLTLKKNTAVFYDIEKSKGVYKLVLKSESTLMFEEDAPLNQPSAVTQPIWNATAENVKTDSADVARTTANGCAMPVQQDEYDVMISEVNAHFFETKKLEAMKLFMQNHCVRVEQLRFMMSKLSQEDNKFDLLKSSLDHIYDRDKLKTVEADFFLEKNKARVYQLIQDHP